MTASPSRRITVGTFTATPHMRALVASVLDSGRISYGPLSLAFEQRFAAMHGAEYAILSNSGTSSLQVALQAMKELHGWQDGDAVILPATTFVSTANIILHNRMVPVFVDVDPLTYNIDPVQIPYKITPKTRAVIPVNLFGQPADLRWVKTIADNHNIKVLCDSCETMFAKHHGQPIGAWCDIAAYSTYVAHLLVTGVGGLSLTNNPDYAGKMRSLANHGMELSSLNPGANFSPQPAPGRRFKFHATGHSMRITEFEAAVGLAQLDDVDEMLAIRRRNARHLAAGLGNLNQQYGDTFQLLTVAEGNECAWMMFPIVLRRGDKESLMAHLNAHGIETRDMLPILGQPAFDYLDPADFPVSANIVRNGLYIGCHQAMTPEDCGYAVDVFGRWLDKDYQGMYL